MRIAYVEDNATNLALVQRIAQMNNHTVVSYAEGEIALQELMHEKFDLILMDVELAGEMSGLQVVRTLRARGLTTPIIAVTAYAMMGDREKCLEAGCSDYLPKPLPIPDFLALLSRYDALLQEHGTTEPPASTAAVISSPGDAAPIVINESHAEPVAANLATLPIHAEPEPHLAEPPSLPTLKESIGQSNAPAHPGKTAAKLTPASEPPQTSTTPSKPLGN